MSYRDDRDALLARLEATLRDNRELQRRLDDYERPDVPLTRVAISPRGRRCRRCERPHADDYVFCAACRQRLTTVATTRTAPRSHGAIAVDAMPPPRSGPTFVHMIAAWIAIVVQLDVVAQLLS